MSAYYNENSADAAAWLRELIKAELIAPGEVDERDIRDVLPAELRAFDQCHFFAGIGVWSYALRRAGWPDDRPVWTGSCPCQPFSTAGRGSGTADERHLWPHWFHLIDVCRPSTVLGEQVSSKDGLGWFDLVRADLEGAGYACGAVDTCAAGFGAPHIRQRLYFAAGGLADADGERHPAPLQRTGEAAGAREPRSRAAIDRGGALSGLGYTHEPGRLPRSVPVRSRQQEPQAAVQFGFGEVDADWLECRDGKRRPVEPGTFPLADGPPARVVRLRHYGNALEARQATAFIEAVRELV